MTMSNLINSEGIRRVAEALLGTCKSLDEQLQQEFDDDSLTIEAIPVELLHKLDLMVWRCSVCDWWVEPHEIDDDVCDECRVQQ